MLWTRTYADDDERCSFCRKQADEVGELIPSPSTPLRYICAACVSKCNSILDQRRAKPGYRLAPGETVIVKYTPSPRRES